MTTRERILLEALDQFSQKGFDAVSVRNIAYAVGIKESSLYNHFTNKQAIFDSILAEYTDRWGELFRQMSLADDAKQFLGVEKSANTFKAMNTEQFTALSGTIFEYYMTDEINVKLRRMLTIEQYRNEGLATLYRKLSFDDSLSFQTQLFAAMMDAGCFKKTDPQLMALAFFSPIFLIFYKYSSDPESLKEAKALFQKHIAHFSAQYAPSAGEKE